MKTTEPAYMHAGAGSSGNQQRRVTKFSKSQLVQVRWQKEGMPDEWWDAEILICHKKENANTYTVLYTKTNEKEAFVEANLIREVSSNQQ